MTDTNLSNLDLLLKPFKPCKIVLEEAGITQYVFEDVAWFASPVVPGVHHHVDWMISMSSPRRLVGIQFWEVHKEPMEGPRP